MSENTMLAMVICTAIASCTACTVAEKLTAQKLTPLERCLNGAISADGKDRCLKAFGKS